MLLPDIVSDSSCFCRATNEDEMCNFYLMYWVDQDSPLQKKYCFTDGPPFYYWANELNNIPNEEASML
jgi:peptidylglycine monooxygenase